MTGLVGKGVLLYNRKGDNDRRYRLPPTVAQP
jgi:hypothetical protein